MKLVYKLYKYLYPDKIRYMKMKREYKLYKYLYPDKTRYMKYEASIQIIQMSKLELH